MAPAPNGGLTSARRRTARSTRSIANGKATTFFTPETKYIWALAIDAQRQPVRRHRRQRRHLQDHARRQGHAVLQDEGDARHGAGVRQDAATCSSAPASPGKVLRDRSGRQGFVLLDSPFQEIRALRFDDKGMLYVAAMNGRAGGGVRRRSCRRLDRSAVDDEPTRPVPTFGLGGDHLDRRSSTSTDVGTSAPVDARGSPDRRRARSTASRPTASGISCGNRAKISPYDVTFDAERRARSSAPATRASSIGSKAIRCGRRCSPAPARSR